jgi:hypothetical protein
MRSLRRFASAAVLAAFVAGGLAVATPAAASTTPQNGAVATNITIDSICGRLANYIAFLEARPASRLRDFLLEQARNLYSRYCQ